MRKVGGCSKVEQKYLRMRKANKMASDPYFEASDAFSIAILWKG